MATKPQTYLPRQVLLSERVTLHVPAADNRPPVQQAVSMEAL